MRNDNDQITTLEMRSEVAAGRLRLLLYRRDHDEHVAALADELQDVVNTLTGRNDGTFRGRLDALIIEYANLLVKVGEREDADAAAGRGR